MRYIGSKEKLLKNIEQVIDENVKDAKIFCDIFSGTGTVAEYFKDRFQIISNDFLYLSYVIQSAKIKNDGVPPFVKLKKEINLDPIDYLNSNFLDSEPFDSSLFFIKNNYSDFCGRSYLTSSNAEKIDKWRITIDRWKAQGLVTEPEYNYLVACVVETVPFFSNISGTYGAYLKTWDRRALKPISLVRLEIRTNNKNNECFNRNSDELIKEIEGDILYMDPPYNQRQYLPNYHLLETIAKYDYPEIHGSTGLRNYSSQKSDWCKKSTVLHALDSMVKNAKFKHVLLSYNTDGLMTPEEIERTLSKYAVNGAVKIYKIPYTRFKSRELKNTSELSELIFYIRKA